MLTVFGKVFALMTDKGNIMERQHGRSNKRKKQDIVRYMFPYMKIDRPCDDGGSHPLIVIRHCVLRKAGSHNEVWRTAASFKAVLDNGGRTDIDKWESFEGFQRGSVLRFFDNRISLISKKII